MNITTKIADSFTLGQVIQQSRLQQNLSQRDLASMLGISQKWVWEMEQGKPGILMNRLFEMLKATGITLYAEFEVKSLSEGAPEDMPEGTPTDALKGRAKKGGAPKGGAMQ